MTSVTDHRRALIVRGGWAEHYPVETTESFREFLRDNGFLITVREDDLGVYDDPDLLGAQDLVVQCWTEGELSEERAGRLAAAVAAGTGLAGWHGGIAATFRNSRTYCTLVGGQFLHHPEGMSDYRVTPAPGRAGHPVLAGIGPFDLHDEKYYCMVDPGADVLATTTFPGMADDGEPGVSEVVMPVVWTRRHGQGRVFVSTPGHSPAELEVPPVRRITERGLLWAAR